MTEVSGLLSSLWDSWERWRSPVRKTSVTETGGQEKESDSQAQSCLLQQKPRGHVGCSRSGMSQIYWECSRCVQNGIPCWEKAEIPMEERAAWSRSWVMQNHADYWSSSPEVELIRRCYAAKRQDESWRLRSRCVMFEIWWLSRSRSTLTSKVGGGEVVARLLCP